MSEKSSMGLYRCDLPEQSGSRRVLVREIERLQADNARLRWELDVANARGETYIRALRMAGVEGMWGSFKEEKP